MLYTAGCHDITPWSSNESLNIGILKYESWRLNLTIANLFMDPWWNPSIEDQADKVYQFRSNSTFFDF